MVYKAPEPRYYYPERRYYAALGGVRTMASPGMSAWASAPMAAAAGLNVTGGGAQGYDQFKKIVDEGNVPPSDVLTVDGFLKEFDLSLTDDHCDQLLCVSPAVTIDRTAKKMYVTFHGLERHSAIV